MIEAAQVARALGHALPAGSVGGASDGNFTAALGIPTIDGLGAVGGGAHARHEHVRIDALPLRAALVAGLIERLSRPTDGEPDDRLQPWHGSRCADVSYIARTRTETWVTH